MTRMKGESGAKSVLILIFVLIAGIVIGGMIGSLTKNVTVLSWLSFYKSFGLDASKPVTVDLSILKITFGFEMGINVAQVICIIGGLLLYRKIR